MSELHNKPVNDCIIVNDDIATLQELARVTDRMVNLVLSCQAVENQISVIIKLEEETAKLRISCVRKMASGEGLVAEVCRQAEEVFQDGVAVWFFSPNYALGGKIPAELLGTEEGAKMLLDAIGRIQWGVYS